jgi:threonine dehydratase
VAEPSGAASLAAHESGAAQQPNADDARVIVISGGNIDPARLVELLSRS